jgi:hypothetical protein
MIPVARRRGHRTDTGATNIHLVAFDAVIGASTRAAIEQAERWVAEGEGAQSGSGQE